MERRGEINWTWAPQLVWEPRKRRYEGKVNMHLPDVWGHVEFAPGLSAHPHGSEEPPADASLLLGESDEAAAAAASDPRVAARAAAMVAYYACHAYREAHRSLSPLDVETLFAAGLLDEESLVPFAVTVVPTAAPADDTIDGEDGGVGFVVTATERASGVWATVNHERLVGDDLSAEREAETCTSDGARSVDTSAPPAAGGLREEVWGAV